MKLLCAFAAIAVAAAANPNLILSHEGLEAGLKLDSNGDINVYAADVAGACVDRRNWCGRYKRDDCTAGAPVKSRLVWRSDDGTVSAAARLHADGKLSFSTSNGGHCIDPMGDATDAQNPIETGLRLTRSGGVRANVVLDPATGLVMHRATGGTVKVGGETAHPECSCANGQAHGIGQNSQCQQHQDHHCETCDDGFMLYNKKCVSCPDGFFKNAGTVASHGQQCQAKKTCAAGHFVSAAGSTTEDRTCSPCPSGTYQDQDDSDRTACAPQPSCAAAGTRYSATATAERTCVPCLDHFYQPNTDHKVAQCSEQPTCGKGEKMSVDTKNAKRECSSCGAGTYQDAAQHRETSCISQPTCTLEVTCQVVAPTTSRKRQCVDVNECSASQWMSEKPTLEHNACGVCTAHKDCTDAQYQVAAGTKYEDTKCALKECTECANGDMATGAACDRHEGSTCASCNTGYYLDGGVCKLHKDCNALGKVQTSAGNGLKDAVCGADKLCVCPEGTGATGTNCPVDGDAKCTACSGAYFIDGIACSAHSVDCNAQGKVVATVATNTADATCGAEKQCVCTNGTGATGTNCPSNGATKCVSCSAGFKKEGITCVDATTCGLYTIAPSSYSTNGMHEHCKTPEYFTTTKDRYANGGQLYQNAVCLNQLSNGWIQEDLGSVQTVTAVRTAGRPNGGQWVTSYQIMTSTNGNSWSDAGTYTGNSDATTVVTRTLSSPKSARFVRLYVRGYSGYASLRMDVVTCRLPAQSQCGITAGSYSSNGLHEHCVTSEYFTTTKDRYANGGQLYQNAACLNQLSNGWIQEDLGSVRQVTGVRTGGRPNGGQWVTSYQIMTSTNGNSWSDAGTYTGNSDATTIVTRTISPVQARYVRLYVRGYSGYASLRMDVTTC